MVSHYHGSWKIVIFLSGTAPGMIRFQDMVLGYDLIIKVDTVCPYHKVQPCVLRTLVCTIPWPTSHYRQIVLTVPISC